MKNLYIPLLVAAALFSCKKTVTPPASTVAALSFANATVGSAPLVTRFNNRTVVFSGVTTTNQIKYGVSNLFSPVNGNNTISFIQSTDTTHTLFTGSFNFQTGGIYSLYLTGTVAQPDTVFIQEHLPVHAFTDSVAGIRFVNLSPGSNPVSVDIKGQTNGSEVQNLAYKAHTLFKTYTANHTVASYVFEFRDASSGTLLASYTLSGVNFGTGTNTSPNTIRFHNLTIALIGQPLGGMTAQSTIMIANY